MTVNHSVMRVSIHLKCDHLLFCVRAVLFKLSLPKGKNVPYNERSSRIHLRSQKNAQISKDSQFDSRAQSRICTRTHTLRRMNTQNTVV